ncbi:restriction endonuclease subunit S [Streptococcus sp. UMB1203]|uniref:restriction endonuclease subunit S n=1 Tax=Streptococcus sp. UMB1203 TaxID=3046327 RepID=UPI002556454A|nr:restriction endonuclease subunit S [Streptococcus sp. UMB1203]MDK7202876.1 restriction endonuclease subunit S [Streptococcus sp. UMB1203]
MKKQINVPSIIFSRFNEDSSWKLKKFKELLDPTEGIRRGPFGSALKKELFVQNSEYVVYEQQNAIYDHFNTRYRISEEKYHELKKFMLLPGDFIMSGAGTIGKISLVPEGIEKGVFNQALIRLRVNKNTDKAFFLQWMRSPEMQNKLTKANPASAMVNLVPMSEVKEWDVIVPSFHEQSAIGYLFRTLDDLLASYKDNLTNYQFLKATMLSKMFPKVGQTVPEIRLEGFEGEWETKILSEVTNITMGQSPKSENYTDNPNDYILVQGNADIKDKQVVPRLWTTEVTKMAEIGDIILTVRAPVGDIGKTDYNVVIGRGVAAIKGNDFIFYTLEKMKKTGFWNRFSTGSTFESISSNNIKEAVIQIPTLKEQQAIGAYFSNLDKLISSYQEKISQLETLKKKLLQDMFI